MFTGLVKELGIVKQVQENKEGREISVYSDKLIGFMEVDDSVSINGACQTVTKIKDSLFTFQSVHVTLQKTTLGQLKVGDRVNMELAVRPTDFMGGHIVQGHVNEVANCQKIVSTGKNYECSFTIAESAMKYIVSEGSITIDGVSLTVSSIDRTKNEFTVSIIPHTWQETKFYELKVGSHVNVEVDIIAKYVENLIYYREKHKTETKMTPEWLAEKGF